MSSISRFLMGCLAFVVTAGLAYPTLAQQQLGAIQGTIVDPSKAVMPGVTVTVTNLDTGLVRTTITNETGVYRVTSLDPGRYKVTAELQGFRSAAQSEVVLSVCTSGVTPRTSIASLIVPGARLKLTPKVAPTDRTTSLCAADLKPCNSAVTL